MWRPTVKKTLFGVLFLALGSVLFAQEGEKGQGADPYKPEWDSLSKHRDPEWFADAKFGIYTHWGPVTVGCEDSGGQWYGSEMYNPGSSVFKFHRERFGDQKTFGYKDVIPLFKAEKFDPEKWADLFARAGARFAGPVAVHHDNFAMWDSDVTPWNAVKMGPKRDITGELAKAYRKRGLKFLTTFHHGFAWKYFEGAFKYDGNDPKYTQLYGEPHSSDAPPTKRYLDQWLGMVKEVLDKYQPDMIWFDFELGTVIPPDYRKRMFADYYSWAARNGKESAVAHKHREIHQYTGVLDFERGREDKLTSYVWLTDTALGPWFNHKSEPYRSTDNLVDTLVDIVSKNGCMLLNVGPNADGTIPEKAEKMLIEVGDWLKVNGEAIYATRPWKTFGEGPVRNSGGGFSEEADTAYTSGDLRFTQSKDGKTLYVFALDWPAKPFTVRSMKAVSPSPQAAIQLLGSDAKVKWSTNEDGQITMETPLMAPEQRPCKHAYAFKLTGFTMSRLPEALMLDPAKAVLEGKQLRLQDVGGENIGFWDIPSEKVHWLIAIPESGHYRVRLRSTAASGKSSMRIETSGKSLVFDVPGTRDWTSIQRVNAGEIAFDKPGVYHVVLQAASSASWKPVNVFGLDFLRVE